MHLIWRRRGIPETNRDYQALSKIVCPLVCTQAEQGF